MSMQVAFDQDQKFLLVSCLGNRPKRLKYKHLKLRPLQNGPACNQGEAYSNNDTALPMSNGK